MSIKKNLFSIVNHKNNKICLQPLIFVSHSIVCMSFLQLTDVRSTEHVIIPSEPIVERIFAHRLIQLFNLNLFFLINTRQQVRNQISRGVKRSSRTLDIILPPPPQRKTTALPRSHRIPPRQC